jgi:hypothetical protein
VYRHQAPQPFPTMNHSPARIRRIERRLRKVQQDLANAKIDKRIAVEGLHTLDLRIRNLSETEQAMGRSLIVTEQAAACDDPSGRIRVHIRPPDEARRGAAKIGRSR